VTLAAAGVSWISSSVQDAEAADGDCGGLDGVSLFAASVGAALSGAGVCNEADDSGLPLRLVAAVFCFFPESSEPEHAA
jgi:hypothetical protein